MFLLSERDFQDFDFALAKPVSGTVLTEDDIEKLSVYERRVITVWNGIVEDQPFLAEWLPLLRDLLEEYQPRQLQQAIRVFAARGRPMKALSYIERPLRNGMFGMSKIERKKRREQKHSNGVQPILRNHKNDRRIF